MGSRVTRVMGFLPANCEFAAPFHSRPRVRHGTERQTDRQTDDGHQRFMPTGGFKGWGGGAIRPIAPTRSVNATCLPQLAKNVYRLISIGQCIFITNVHVRLQYLLSSMCFHESKWSKMRWRPKLWSGPRWELIAFP